ncbi:MAG TPA: hypothetical protein VFC14_07500 [Burkholderiales bacterium]|nr:hypothetical protein [Burkholderiales bacterium]
MSIVDEISLEIIESLRRNDGLRRKHASFWNFHKKSSKELGLFSERFHKFESDYRSNIIGWALCEKDPPDVFANLADGRKIGIEITELVNEAAIDAQIRKPDEYSEELFQFGFDEASEEIRRIVREKEEKLFPAMSDYDELALLIHTDEFLLKSDQFAPGVAAYILDNSRVFESVYLLFSYEPDKQQCPLVKLK